MANIDDKVLKKIEGELNSTIKNLLYGGGGDAGWAECAGAAACFRTLKSLNLTVKDEEDTRKFLETDNICEENFLA
jgi:hypothetical protein